MESDRWESEPDGVEYFFFLSFFLDSFKWGCQSWLWGADTEGQETNLKPSGRPAVGLSTCSTGKDSASAFCGSETVRLVMGGGEKRT